MCILFVIGALSGFLFGLNIQQKFVYEQYNKIGQQMPEIAVSEDQFIITPDENRDIVLGEGENQQTLLYIRPGGWGKNPDGSVNNDPDIKTGQTFKVIISREGFSSYQPWFDVTTTPPSEYGSGTVHQEILNSYLLMMTFGALIQSALLGFFASLFGIGAGLLLFYLFNSIAQRLYYFEFTFAQTLRLTLAGMTPAILIDLFARLARYDLPDGLIVQSIVCVIYVILSIMFLNNIRDEIPDEYQLKYGNEEDK